VDRRDIDKVKRAIGRWAKPAKHTPYTQSFIVLSDETAMELVDRLTPVLDEIPAVETYYGQAVTTDVVGRYGLADPFRSRVLEAWAELAQRNKPKHLANRWPRDGRVKDGIKKLSLGTPPK